ncbi:MAG: glycosyltransferase family 39 protein [bacterium]|nr:glycosyltransferase family 39 protein [bacterium]
MILQKIFNRQNIIIFIILTLGFILRFYHLTTVPAGFFCDEATIGYNAYKIMTTGRDESGVLLPIFFKSLVFAPPITIYSTIPFVALFGMNEFAVRFQAVLFGIITILFIYLIGKEIISKNCGLWSAFIAAILPWLIHYNRVGFDYSSYIAALSGSIFFLIKATSNKRFIILFFIFLGLTFYSYQPAKLFVPFLLLIGIVIYGKRLLLYPKYVFIGCVLFFLISLPMFLHILSGEGFIRLNQISIFSVNLTIKEKINKFASNYFYQFSPTFLLSKGDANNNRSLSGGLIPILPITFPFLIFGLIELLKKIKHNYSQLLLFLVITYPVAGAITMDGPFSGRSFIGAFLIALITGIGISSLIKIFSKKTDRIIVSLVFIVFFIVNLLFFIRFYFIEYPLYSSDFWGWQYGPKEIIKYFVKVQSSYDDLYLNAEFNGSEIFYKFYDPLNLCNNKCQIDTFYVHPYIINPNRRQLFTLSPDTLNKSLIKEKFLVKKTIYYPNNTIAFLIGEIVQ